MKTRSVVLLIVTLLLPFGFARAQGSEDAVRAQLRSQGAVEHVLLNAQGRPAYIRCDLDYSARGATALDRAWAFCETNASLYGMRTPRRELTLARQTTDERGVTHIKFRQLLEGIPVFEGQLAVHVRPDGHITAANGHLIPYTFVDVKPTLSAAQAREIAAAALGAAVSACDFSPDELLIYAPDDAPHLAWRIRAQVRGSAANGDLFVDAHSGSILQKYSLVRE